MTDREEQAPNPDTARETATAGLSYFYPIEIKIFYPLTRSIVRRSEFFFRLTLSARRLNFES